jgi:predicted DNA-binding helix-hairpin-helix protein
LPNESAGALREHRLYQADWLLRFYGFSVEELVEEKENLDIDVDPKCAWALKNIHLFPVEVNSAPLEVLLRVPGIGVRNAHKILQARRFGSLAFEDLLKMKVALKRAKHFITCKGKYYGSKKTYALRGLLCEAETGENAQQLNLFSSVNAYMGAPFSPFIQLSTPQNAQLALTGEL